MSRAVVAPVTRERDPAGAPHALRVKTSRRARRDIERDLLDGRKIDFRDKFLPDTLSRATELAFLNDAERCALSQVQGRTYARLFGLNRVEALIARGMPTGYGMVVEPGEVALAVLSKSAWALLALTCHIELSVQSHYERSIGADTSVAPLFRDLFRYRWQEECQHEILDEMEWRRVHDSLSSWERDQGVTDLADLIAAVDGVLRAQAAADSTYFLRMIERGFQDDAQRAVRALFLRAYRWQYILGGVDHPHFNRLLVEMTTARQLNRIQLALMPLLTG
jgi:hypothetical protein